MKKAFLFSLSLLISASSAIAQETKNFYEDIIISGAVKEQQQNEQLQTKRQAAEIEAQKLMRQNPKKLEIKNLSPRKISPKVAPKTANPADLSSAPFGLMWSSTVADTQNLGVSLQKIQEKDYANSYSATNLPKSIKDFRQVDLTFGLDNELWRIIAYGDFIEDSADASGVLRQYRRYYQLLEKKYGNAQQFYTPRPTTDENQPRSKKAPTEDQDTIGGKNFLTDLQSGEAVLYATFEGNNIGAAISVNVDGGGRSYIIIDYKNLKILREREQKAYDAL